MDLGAGRSGRGQITTQGLARILINHHRRNGYKVSVGHQESFVAVLVVEDDGEGRAGVRCALDFPVEIIPMVRKITLRPPLNQGRFTR